MTKRALIKAAHVRNERFISEIKSIIELLPPLYLAQATRIQAMSNGYMLDSESLNALLRVEVVIAKALLDRLEALFDTWPNAVWLFFPETGASDWIRFLTEFHTKIFPLYFPEAPQHQLWRTKRVRGYRWCGVSTRIRKESLRTFMIWDQFKTGRRPMDIVRREFPLRPPEHGRKSKKELMAVRRGLERASQLIYGQPMPTKRTMRRLLGYNYADHMATCVQCRNAESVNEFCQLTQDFVNQDQKS
jgi:hypothetical protein